MNRLPRTLLALFALFPLGWAASGEAKPKPWEKMDYGPYLSATYKLTADNKRAPEDYKALTADYALKGTAIRLDKERQAYLLYDLESMRVVAGWSGGFIDYNGVIFDGNHHAQPMPKGTIHFRTKPGPGWARAGTEARATGGFDDPRPEHSGPLEWIKYKGLYLHGEKVILSYRIGDCDVLEMPGVIFDGAAVIFTRTIHLSKCSQALVLAVSDLDKGITSACAGGGKAKSANEGGRYVVKIPPLKEPLTIKAALGIGLPDGLGAVGRISKATAAPADLLALTQGGPPRWTETITTQGTLGEGTGPYVVDTLAAPESNPWNSWLRFGGFDFFPDGKSAAICTWSGDVWIVSGIDDGLQKLTWKRFATGLYQPLGLKIVDGKIYCTCRDQITRLHDLNNDGEADFYECFNGEMLLTRHFHEFTMDLQTDTAGNFYFAKGCTPGRGGPNFDLWTPHNGCFFRLSKDGSKLDVVARGLRAPNGIGIGPNSEMTSGDNEGSWVPQCPINWIKPGGFVGIPDGVPGEPKPAKRDPPLCWLPKSVDNSGGGQVWVTSDKWGPFQGKMLHTSYGKCALFNVMMESVPPAGAEARGTDVVQGGVARFPDLSFSSGIMRPRFNPADGQLYLCGLKGWQTDAARDGCFQRVRYTGKPVHAPLELHVTKFGLSVTFTNALDPAAANDPANYGCEQCNLKWSKTYGSKEWSVAEPEKQGRDTVTIKSATLQADGKTVALEIPGIQPVNIMALTMRLKAADGTPIVAAIHHTINRVP